MLVIAGASRNDGTCPGEMSKTFRLAKIVTEVLAGQDVEVDLLDLSLISSEYERHIHPCKGCVSTAMPLCHWPCSCYPNHGLGQENDWMAEIYERWAAAHGVVIVTPVHWYQTPSVLKLMIDRLVCADGGNPDPTTTGGKNAGKAKALELAGWAYPKHLAGRTYGLVVHGDVAGIEDVRRALSDWLDWMGLVDAGAQARLDRYIGYYEPYATSHDALDADTAVQEEVRNVARAVVRAVGELRNGHALAPRCRPAAAAAEMTGMAPVPPVRRIQRAALAATERVIRIAGPSPWVIFPITAARSKPSRANTVSTSSTASGAHATSRPPDVCGSVRSASSASSTSSRATCSP